MQTLSRMNMVVIKDYNLHMNFFDENAYWMKLTHLLLEFSLNLRVLQFCTSTFTSKILITF